MTDVMLIICVYFVMLVIFQSVPPCKVVRFNIEYTLHWIEEDAPEVG